MTLSVRLFARARDLAGTETVSVDLPGDATVGDLRRALPAVIPALESLASRLLVAVGNDYADDSQTLSPGDDVVCFPPVSGG